MIAVRRLFVILLVWSLSVPAGVPLRALTTLGSGEGGQRPAPGQPYSGDCAQAIPAAERLERGLAVHKDTIARAQAIIDAASRSGAPPPAAGGPSIDIAKGLLMQLMATANALREQIEKLTLSQGGSETRTRVLKEFDRIAHVSNGIDVLLAWGKYKQAMDEVTNLQQAIEAIGTYLMDSGLGDTLAAEAAGSLLAGTAAASMAGPIGILLMEATVLGIEVGANAIQAEIDAGEVRQAQATLDAVKFQKGLVDDRIRNLKDFCRPTPKPETKQNASAKEPARIGKWGGSGGKSGNAGKIVLPLLGLVAAGAGVAILVPQLKKLKSADCGIEPTIPGSCLGMGRDPVVCNALLDQYRTWCSCNGRTLNMSTGSCER